MEIDQSVVGAAILTIFTSMQKKTKDNQFIKKPIYPGGLKAMREFIKSVMKYPAEALEAKVEGTVYLKYEVGHKGKIGNVRIVSGIGHGCDEEAKRIVSLFKFQIPKNPRKLRIKFNKSIRINFRLPKTKPTPKKIVKKVKAPTAKPKINYTVVTTPKRTAAPKPKKSGYSYTIKF